MTGNHGRQEDGETGSHGKQEGGETEKSGETGRWEDRKMQRQDDGVTGSQGRQEDGETESKGSQGDRELGRQEDGETGRIQRQTCPPTAHTPSDLLLLSKAPNSDSTPGSESRYL